MAVELMVVMPVYNEEAAIGGVLERWQRALERLKIAAVIRATDDGSRDRSLEVMKAAAERLNRRGRVRIEVVTQANSGHGPTVLGGYRAAAAAGAEWVFQIDSDDEMGPEGFAALWSRRGEYDFLVGRRAGRRQPWPRRIVSLVSRLVVRFGFGRGRVWDVNAPYRLLRVAAFGALFAEIPDRTFAPNLLVTGAAAERGLKALELPVAQRERRTGEVSIRKWKLLAAAVKGFAQTLAFAARRRWGRFVWPLVTFGLSLGASTLGGRSLWMDEIMRVVAQRKYSVAELLECRNLAEFDSQSPIGYLLWRPVQTLLGMEAGGFVLSALAAALVTAAALKLVRRLQGREASLWAGALIALNPLVVYYGGELWFYMPWAAAFAMAFLPLADFEDDSLRRRLAVALWGALFVALHFAGIFIWAAVGVVAVALWWRRRGLRSALWTAVAMALPALIMLPLYLKARAAASHLNAAGLDFAALATLPKFYGRYLTEIFPSLTGGWYLGAAAALVGVLALWRRGRRAELALLLAVVFAEAFYLGYTHLGHYPFVVARFWLYALIATLPLVALGVDALVARSRAFVPVAVALLALSLVGTTAVLSQEGRTQPFRQLAGLIAERGSVVFPNHYDARPFTLCYLDADRASVVYPAYWEQGEAARAEGLRLIRSLSPLTPAYVDGNGTPELAASCGWTNVTVVAERRSPVLRLAIAARLFPEPENCRRSGATLLLPEEAELVREAERTGKCLFAPGRGRWRLASLPPRAASEPLFPYLSLAPGERAALRVYVPAAAAGARAKLHARLGSDREAEAEVGGRRVKLTKTFGAFDFRLQGPASGWQELEVDSRSGMFALALPEVKVSR